MTALLIKATVTMQLLFARITTVFLTGGGGELAFFDSAIDVLKTIVLLLGGGLAVWGIINLLEGYGNDNPSAKSQGMKQLMAGVGVAIVGLVLVPMLKNLFTTGS